jgi:preprotein translocase subunit SecE
MFPSIIWPLRKESWQEVKAMLDVVFASSTLAIFVFALAYRFNGAPVKPGAI